MTLEEFCQRWRISKRKAREMDKSGVLRLDSGSSPIVASALRALRSGVDLSPLHLVHLMESPDDLRGMGFHANKVSKAIEALDNPAQDKAPREVSACVPRAAKGDADAIETVRIWICEALPDKPVHHAWLACRLLLPMPRVTRQEDARLVNSALARVRRLPEFAFWWHIENVRKGKKRTIYHRPLDI